ncbi:RNA methyltransferase [Aurantimonas sp. Leaf443]|uniref:TrmH family RNA methyltransferase n=1 Tax=Aurantimonas sp. Leaf443 TaxID=1736378 RepID=UPI0006FBAA8E|nr:RNA methyltransferase [Aurantimonas sp. Leaf443]KQT88162.1 RNA methyltransferase [Aurantimonas sp. Leaf443]
MPDLVDLTDPTDSRLEAFRDVRERDLAREGAFIAEGTVVLDQLFASRAFRPVSLLVLRNRLAGLMPRLSHLAPDVPVYVAEQDVFDGIAGFHVHRGVLAHAVRRAPERPIEARLAEIAASGGTVVAALGLSNHDNMGALFRNAAAFGAGAVLLDDRACDPLYRKAIRVSVGTVLTLPFHRFARVGDLFSALAAAGFRTLALSPAGRTRLQALAPDGATALVLGTEGEGLPPALLSRHETLAIDMAPGLDSLNVATTAAIVLHHLYCGRRSG